LAFDEARFGLINWHRRRYCPKGFRPPYVVRRSYEWTYLYAAVESTTGESYCLYLPGMDDGCLQIFLGELSKAYPEEHLLVVLDGAPSHRSEKIVHPENVSLLELPASNGSPDTLGGWRRWRHYDINSPERYKRQEEGLLCTIGTSRVSPAQPVSTTMFSLAHFTD